jgi:hypothetical protein
MNPITHTEHSRQTAHLRIGSGMWDDFEPAPRRPRRPVAAERATRIHARPQHSHLSWSETPDLYLREEMA